MCIKIVNICIHSPISFSAWNIFLNNYTAIHSIRQIVETLYYLIQFRGGVAEWSNAAVLKTVDRSRGPWVQIPPPPPFIIAHNMTFSNKWFSYIKFSFTILVLFTFVVVVGYADRFRKSNDTLYVNTLAFAQTADTSTDSSINLEMIAVEAWGTAWWVITYIVQPWDTLSQIASRFWTTVSQIKKTNWLGGSIRPGQKLIITSEENWLLYTIPERINILVFANKYSLDIEDLMTLNYIQDETEMLQEWQEVFLPIALNTAYDVWLMERPKEVYKPKQTVSYTPKITKSSASVVSKWSSTSAGDYSSSTILSSRVYNKNINNKFYAWHCTWYVAATTPQIFPYIDATTQARPFGWNANQWYENAKAAWFSVWKTPVVWSIVVYYRWGWSFSSAWHVAKVVSIDSAASTMVVEEMNWSKKFVVQRRRDKLNNSNIKWYIYMPSTPWTPN